MGHGADGPARHLLREACMPKFAVVGALMLLVAAAAANATGSEPGALGTPVVAETQAASHPDVVLTSNLGLAWYRPALDLEVPLSGHHAIVLDVTWQLASKVHSTIGEGAPPIFDGTTTGLVPRLRFDVGFAW